MKLQLDTISKTIKLEDKVNIGDLIKTLSKLLPNGEYKDFTLEVNTEIKWSNPIVINPYRPYNPWRNPWYVGDFVGDILPQNDYTWTNIDSHIKKYTLDSNNTNGSFSMKLEGPEPNKQFTLGNGIFNIEIETELVNQ